MPFGSDQVLLYDCDPWNKLGFGVPAFGAENVGTLNRSVHGLADEIGRNQLYVMTHVDAMRLQPPSRNTVERLGKMINRVQSILVARQKDYPEIRLEEGHARPAPLIWTIHPVPYFRASLVRNKWLAEYNDLVMISLTNIYQHSDNNLALTITASMAKDIWQYFREIKIRLGSELLGLKVDDLAKDEFVFDAPHYDNYRPDKVVVNIEPLDKPGPIFNLPTEKDLYELLQGIPATTILPLLKQYPVGPVPGATGQTGQPFPDGAAASGVVTGEAIGSPVL